MPAEENFKQQDLAAGGSRPDRREEELAARSVRLKAALVDLGLAFVIYLAGRLQPFGTILGVVCVLALWALIVYQWVLLTKHGQTIGKKIFDIRIVKLSTGENGGFVANVALRSWVSGLLNLIPLFFIVDSLFIFRDDRRCIHDFIAGTRVVSLDTSVPAQSNEIQSA